MIRFQYALLAAVAVVGAAPLASAQPMPPTDFNWNGIYAGGYLGGSTTSNATTSDPCLSTTLAACAATDRGTYNGVPPLGYTLPSSFSIGGQVGYNWQMPRSNVVLGVEDEFGFLNMEGSAIMNPTGNGDTTAHATVGSWYDAYTVRAGFAWDKALLYAKVGGVSAGYSTGVVDVTGPTTINTTRNETRSGFAAGAGFEYGITRNWSLTAEYLYLGLDATTNSCAQVGGFPPGTIDCTYTKTNGVNTFKFGANYHFR